MFKNLDKNKNNNNSFDKNKNIVVDEFDNKKNEIKKIKNNNKSNIIIDDNNDNSNKSNKSNNSNNSNKSNDNYNNNNKNNNNYNNKEKTTLINSNKNVNIMKFEDNLKNNNKQYIKSSYVWLSVAFVVILVLSNIAASNTMDIGGFISLSAAELLFPISYVISDLFVEIYGFKQCRKLIFIGLTITLISMVFLFLTTLLPTGYTEYQTVFGFFSGGVIGITFASILAYIVGSLVNAFIMTKLKQKHGEKKFFIRAILSTLVAEILDSLIFITFCCLFAPQYYSWDRLLQFVLTIATIKVLVEIIVFPITKNLLKLIRKKESF